MSASKRYSAALAVYRDTSREAWEAFQQHLGAVDAKIVACIAVHGLAIAEVVEDETGLKHQTVSAQIRHMVAAGVLRDSGQVGRTLRGRKAILWQVAPPGSSTPPRSTTPVRRVRQRQNLLRNLPSETEPIHAWFELTYSSYLCLPRSVLQSAPVEWQRRFVLCLRELDAMFGHLEGLGDYDVRRKDPVSGRYLPDPLARYDRGRRRIQARGEDAVCEHGTALDVHCCNCHSGFIFDKDHECPTPEAQP
jgi:hypothetical protein